MSPITVRQAVLSDLDDLVPLFDRYRRFYRQSSDPDGARAFLSERFEHGESVLFIAHDDGAPAGFVQLYPSFSSTSMTRMFVLNDLYVDERRRRKGVASRLIAAAADYARSVGATSMELSTATTNTSAQALYESLGWQRDVEFLVYNHSLEE